MPLCQYTVIENCSKNTIAGGKEWRRNVKIAEVISWKSEHLQMVPENGYARSGKRRKGMNLTACWNQQADDACKSFHFTYDC